MDFINRIKATWNPNRYHGWGKRKNFFEGWYFKLVDHTEKYALAVIPGVSMDENGKQEAFIQVLDDFNNKADFHRFPFEAFKADPEKFAVEIGNNRFSKSEITLDLPGLKGSLKISEIVDWPKAAFAPGIMGWYSFVPFMQCYHGIVSMNNRLNGNLQLGEKSIDFINAKGYIEKDWGRSFPKAWIWLQSNHFEGQEEVSLMASAAHIPWMGHYFIGFLVGIYWKGEVIRFATYLGSKMTVDLGEKSVRLVFESKPYRLEIDAQKEEGSELISPISGDMIGKIDESIRSISQFKLFKNEELIGEGTSKRTAMELGGELASSF